MATPPTQATDAERLQGHQHFRGANLPEMVLLLIKDDIDGSHQLMDERPDAALELDADGYSPLHWAAAMGRMEFVDLLLSAGSDVNAGKAFPPLHLAVLQNQTDVVNFLVEKGADVNQRSSKGVSPIVHAVDEGPEWLDVLKTMLSNGAEVNAEENQSVLRIPLIGIAAMRGDDSIVRTLLDHGANRWKLTSYGHSPLLFAVSGFYTETVKLLLSYGEDAPTPSKKLKKKLNKREKVTERTPMHFAVTGSPQGKSAERSAGRPTVSGITKESVSFNSTTGAQVEIIEMLLNAGAKIDPTDSKGMMPIQLAAEENHWELVELFLKRGSKIPDKEKFDLMEKAVEAEQQNVVDLLSTKIKADEGKADL